jgi:flagellar biosynthesis/type III secretory pathway protein FliH
MEKETATRHASGYYEGYSQGYNEGYNKALENLPQILATMQAPKIIITTEENILKIKEQYNIK